MTSIASIALPDDVIWTDEHEWTPVKQSASRTLGGRLIVEYGQLIVGRPITLNCHWLSFTTLNQLIVLRDEPGVTMLLTLSDGRVLNTLFRHSEGDPVKATPVIDYPAYDADDQFDVTLKLMEI